MGKIVLAALLGGLIYVVVLAISWSLPFHAETLRSWPVPPTGDAALVTLPESGIYQHPSIPTGADEATEQAAHERMLEGRRLAFVVYREEPSLALPLKLLRSFGGGVLTALLIAILLRSANLQLYVSRVGFVVAIALALAIAAEFETWNFFEFPTAFALLGAIDVVVAWTLAGLVFAKLIHPVKFPKRS